MATKKPMSPLAIIDKSLERRQIDRTTKERVPHRYWPTQASIRYKSSTDSTDETQVVGSCLRKEYYRMTEEPETNPMDARGVRITTMGKIVEQQEIQWAKEAGIFKENNIKFETEIGGLTISGEVDAFYVDPETNETIGIEYKTGYNYMFDSEVIGNARRVGKPKLDHLLQVGLYLHHFSDVPYFVIIYINRGSMEKKEHIVRLYQASDINKRIVIVNDSPMLGFSIGAIYARYKLLDDHLSTGNIPERDFEIRYDPDKVERRFRAGKLSKAKYEAARKGKLVGDWQCIYCPFRTKCYGGRY